MAKLVLSPGETLGNEALQLSVALQAAGLQEYDRLTSIASGSADTLRVMLATTALGEVFSSRCHQH